MNVRQDVNKDYTQHHYTTLSGTIRTCNREGGAKQAIFIAQYLSTKKKMNIAVNNSLTTKCTFGSRTFYNFLTF